MDGDRKQVIPVIDFKRCGLMEKEVTEEDLRQTGIEMVEAFSKTGFCYIKNHGVNDDIITAFMELMKTFFEKPMEVKSTIERKKGGFEVFGWQGVESENLDPSKPGDLKEAFSYLPALEPGVWPMEGLQGACQETFALCWKLSYRICDALSVGLGIDKDFLRKSHSNTAKSLTALRTLYYPPLDQEREIRDGQTRLGEHSDFGTFTLLFQDDVGGLEVEIPGEGYVPATPIPGTIVVNIGDLLQRWTSDTLIATKHRVRIPEEEIKKRTHRMSTAFFVIPDDDCLVTCLDGSSKYEPITARDYMIKRISLSY